mmetsp:Transcript_64384/g.181196  ORF Transcript_64384/g.181196 Transcript_64384/m.181196 type:complete len:440 (-) Transcript_64384:45-1364(-)
MMGLGGQGMSQSQGFSVTACTIFRVSIRVSYYVLAYLAFQVYMALQSYLPLGGTMVLYGVGTAVAQFGLLYLTVLVHEFGHGTMSRCLGGEIDHILLWPFGGICFSSRPEEENATLLVKNDFKVVAAGPATHIPQTLFWALVGLLLVTVLNATACDGVQTRGLTQHGGRWWADGPENEGCFSCEGVGCLLMFLNPLSPQASYAPALQQEHLGLYFLYNLPLTAINLNLMLFVFNVFFPMYPMDSAKMLTSSLMYFCKVSPYRAAAVLIACSSTCAVLLITWAVYTFQQGVSSLVGGHVPGGGAAGLSAFSGVLPGLLGLMALQEAYTIYNLRHENRLSEHSYFRAARTHTVQTRDRFGVVTTLNRSGRDDRDLQPFGGGGSPGASTCCLCRCFCPWTQPREPRPVQVEVPQTPTDPEAARRMREDRMRFLQQMEGSSRR